MNMCSALAALGHDVTLVAKHSIRRQEAGVPDEFRFYDMGPSFSLQKLPRPNWRGGGLVFAYRVWRLLKRGREQFDLVYSRDLPGACAAVWQKYATIYETHELPSDRVGWMLLRWLTAAPQLRRVVVVSRALRSDLEASGVIPPGIEILVAPDSARSVVAAAPQPLEPRGLRHVGYVGNLYPGKGMEIILELAQRMPDVVFHVVGGRSEELARWTRVGLPENLVLHGFVQQSALPPLMAAFDAVLLPLQQGSTGATGRTDISRWTSPLKLFEYMAAGKLIVASDLPALREILTDGENALLVSPSDAPAWEIVLRRAFSDRALADRLAQAARRDFLASYTWAARAAAVLSDV